MPYTQESSLAVGTVIKTALALSKLRLFKNSFAPNALSVKADFVAAECDYDGYVAGGIAVTAFLGPAFNPTGGAMITSPVTNFTYVAGVPLVGNMVGGWWLETAAGLLWAYTVFPQPISMAVDGNQLPLVIQFLEGTN